MRATILFAIAALTIAATDARPEAWSVQKPDGSWVNTEHHPDSRPKPQPPKQIPGDKSPPNLRADKSDYIPGKPYEQHWTGICKRLPDGRIITHTAFLRDRATAHAQCKARIMGASDDV